MTVVDKAFLISLKIRADRYENFQKRYPPSDLLPEVQLWNAVHGDVCVPPDNWHAGNGAWGCYRSHMAILEHCINEGVDSYIVFEDDAQFRKDFQEEVANFFSELPQDWEMVYLGGQLLHEHAHPPIKISKNVYLPFNVNRTHCFALRGNGLRKVYRHCSNLPFHTAEHIDHHLGRLHESGNINLYCPGRWLVGQGGVSSNISGKRESVNFFNDAEAYAMDHPLYKKPACVVLRGPRDIAEALCENLCHKGYELDRAGYDRGLCEAWKYKDPAPEIRKWFSMVRTEIVKTNQRRVPLLWHPRITDEMIEEAAVGEIYRIETTRWDNAKSQVENALSRIY